MDIENEEYSMDGHIMLAKANVYLECGETGNAALLIKTPERIESEVNDFIGYIWASLEPLAREANDYDNAQHQLCHVTAHIYNTFHSLALDTYAITGNESLWVLVESLTDKVVACNTHVKELNL